MSLVNNISARKKSRRQIGGPPQPLRAGAWERKWGNGGMISYSRSLLSADECLVVITGTIYGVTMNSLTPFGPAASAPLVANHYVRTSLAAVCNGILSRELLY